MHGIENGSFKIVFENELTWKQHNDLHKCVNQCFSSRTNSFKLTSFGRRTPVARVLCYIKNKLVGTAAYYEDLINLDSQVLRVGGLGLLCSILPGNGIGNECRRIISQEITKMCHTELCISRVSDKTVNSKTAKNLFFGFINATMIGANSSSHEWEKIAVYNTFVDPIVTKSYFDKMNKLNEIKLLFGDVF